MYSFCDGRLTLRNCLSSPDDINMLGKIDKQYLCLVPSFVPKDLEDMYMNNLSRTIPNKNYDVTKFYLALKEYADRHGHNLLYYYLLGYDVVKYIAYSDARIGRQHLISGLIKAFNDNENFLANENIYPRDIIQSTKSQDIKNRTYDDAKVDYKDLFPGFSMGRELGEFMKNRMEEVQFYNKSLTREDTYHSIPEFMRSFYSKSGLSKYEIKNK